MANAQQRRAFLEDPIGGRADDEQVSAVGGEKRDTALLSLLVVGRKKIKEPGN